MVVRARLELTSWNLEFREQPLPQRTSFTPCEELYRKEDKSQRPKFGR